MIFFRNFEGIFEIQNQSAVGNAAKFEHFLKKIRIPNFKIQSLGRAKRKGVGGKEFLPALAFRFQFFSAAAEFRISLCEMRRQEKRCCVCPAHPCAHNKNSLVKIKEKMYSNNMISI